MLWHLSTKHYRRWKHRKNESNQSIKRNNWHKLAYAGDSLVSPDNTNNNSEIPLYECLQLCKYSLLPENPNNNHDRNEIKIVYIYVTLECFSATHWPEGLANIGKSLKCVQPTAETAENLRENHTMYSTPQFRSKNRLILGADARPRRATRLVVSLSISSRQSVTVKHAAENNSRGVAFHLVEFLAQPPTNITTNTPHEWTPPSTQSRS